MTETRRDRAARFQSATRVFEWAEDMQRSGAAFSLDADGSVWIELEVQNGYLSGVQRLRIGQVSQQAGGDR